MSSIAFAPTNGSKPYAKPESWLQSTVQQFFTALNWEDSPPEVQEVKISAAQLGNAGPLSLSLSVSQFFSALNWEGTAIAAPIPQEQPTLQPAPDNFTLDAFSDLF
ncbi:hypothetical protein K9N68_00740 [Kovacikia minuta CCNUW1]|uniref:hypothetical protein n=1 Tax=Kovacikia minuta TaxID=2931930 RepID=UPI001CCB4ED2|nr:hypothetical protein [Kovacikia minuta]UBF26574.1 hypothetical protein K9N68_00740 [Kovacikia minuta CCNUW1]